MSLQTALLLALLTWFSSEVAPRRLNRNFRYGTASNKLRHLADHSMHDSRSTFNGDLDKSQSDATLMWEEKYTGGRVKQLKKSVKPKGLKMHKDGELEQIDSLDLSLSCSDVQTRLSLSDRPQSPGFLSLDILKSCGYAVPNEDKNKTVLVKDCDVTLVNGQCSTRMKYETVDGQLADVTLPCSAQRPRVHRNRHSDDLINFDSLQSDGPVTPHDFKCVLPPTNRNGPRCNIDKGQRIQCGLPGISSSACWDKVCCFDAADNNCTYPMNECTADKHFAFVVNHNLSAFALNLTMLKTSGASDCAPKIITKEFAVFFFPITDCGARSYVVGESTVFSVEVLTSISSVPAISGNVSRDVQFRLMVECRYGKGQTPDLSNIVSTGFMVKSPYVFPMVQSEGFFGVQLRISEDAGYTKFYPAHHQPLRVLLGKPVYLQVNLKSPNPTATLLVHYCIAYPKSATKALVLLHDGCPNPLDRNGVVIASLPGNRYERRFAVKAFQFMVAPDKYLDEQIYFLCSTELCFHKNGMACNEGCFAVVN